VQLDREYDHVAVSKLCCPICWDLFEVVRDEGGLPELSVRGHHPSLCMVRLPSTLPKSVLIAMINRYRSRLHQELGTMVNMMTLDRPFTPMSDTPLSYSSVSSMESNSKFIVDSIKKLNVK
jgi:hypothetical protein